MFYCIEKKENGKYIYEIGHYSPAGDWLVFRSYNDPDTAMHYTVVLNQNKKTRSDNYSFTSYLDY